MTRYVDGFEGLADLFGEMERQLFDHDFTPAMATEIGHLQETHRRHFENQADPGGTPWAPLSPATVAMKGRRSGHQAAHETILVDTGRLFESLVVGPASSDSDRIREVGRLDDGAYLTFGTDVPYSIFHETGTARMPARVHVGMAIEDVDAMTDRLADAALNSLRGD